MHTKLARARFQLATKTHPYLATALWSLVPVERPGLGTMAVDKWWRLYFDPDFVERKSDAEIAGVLYHEIQHLLRRHAERLAGYPPLIANLAGDVAINDDIRQEGVTLPEEGVFPEKLGLEEKALEEEYADELMRRLQTQQPAPQGGAAQPQGAGGTEAGEHQQGGGNEAGNRPFSGSDTGTNRHQLGNSGAGAATPSDAAAGNPADTKAGDAGGSNPSASSASSADGSRPSTGQVGNGRTELDNGGRCTDNGAQTPAPTAGRCGSCATGHPAPWEEPPPDTPGAAPGVTPAEAELIRRAVATAIVQHAQKTRGKVPGHWERWAEDTLRPPKVDWRKELAAAIRHAIADMAGAADYSYRKPSRRQSAVSGIVLPGLKQPLPRVAVIIDTSGSVSDAELEVAVAEVGGILQALGFREGVTVLAVDAAVQATGKVFSPKQVRHLLQGGGGTDMCVGINAAAKMRPKPQVVITITDGVTPWPNTPPAGIRPITVLLGNSGEAPKWGKVIRVEV